MVLLLCGLDDLDRTLKLVVLGVGDLINILVAQCGIQIDINIGRDTERSFGDFKRRPHKARLRERANGEKVLRPIFKAANKKGGASASLHLPCQRRMVPCASDGGVEMHFIRIKSKQPTAAAVGCFFQ